MADKSVCDFDELPAKFLIVFGLMGIAGCSDREILSQLNARMQIGDLGTPPCAPLPTYLRPLSEGTSDVLPGLMPGANRFTFVEEGSGWGIGNGMAELQVFTQAGFFTRRDRTENGTRVREFELTPKGYLAMAADKPGCFTYQHFSKVELLKAESIVLPDGMYRSAKGYNAKYRVHHEVTVDWAKSPEFSMVFRHSGAWSSGTASDGEEREQVFLKVDGAWLLSNEALARAAHDAELSRPGMAEYQERQRREIEDHSFASRQVRFEKLKAQRIASTLAGLSRRETDPCIEFPARGFDTVSGFDNADSKPAFVFLDASSEAANEHRETAMEFARRLEFAGLARSERFDEPASGRTRAGKGIRYLIDEEFANARNAVRHRCVAIGEAVLKDLRTSEPTPEGLPFRGWATLRTPKPWTASLAAQFPSVKYVVEHGFGIAGVLRNVDGLPVRVATSFPQFSITRRREIPFTQTVSPDATTLAFTEESNDGAPLMLERPGCAVSADGTTVSDQCSYGAPSRRYRAGKSYVELAFLSSDDGKAQTWTGLSVVTERDPGQLPRVGASHQLVGMHGKVEMKSGDTIGLAFDMDDRVLYWSFNGNWRTGRPGSGVGLTLSDGGAFFSVALTDRKEAWKVNFGETPFRHPAPVGYQAYGTKLLGLGEK